MNDESKTKEVASCRPGSLVGVVCLVCVCAAIGLVAYHLAPQPEAPRRLWLPVVVSTNGEQAILGDMRQFEFWTPSAKTGDYLHKEGGEVVAEERWEAIPSDDVVVQFGQTLHSNRNVLGYRRIEEWGQGRSNFKPGWWWTVNVFSNYSALEMGRAYQDFWKSRQTVFIEVIDSRGHKE
jgi:hypothetical protein